MNIQRTLCRPLLLLALFVVATAGTAANTIDIRAPLTVPIPYLEARAAELLGLDPDGRGQLAADKCNRLELFDLSLHSHPGEADAAAQLQVELGVRAQAGARLFGRCRGPGSIDGRVRMQLTPRAGASGQAVIFDATAVEFRRSDGSEGLLTPASRLLAETLLVPRLESMRVDVADSLRQIDALIERFIGVDASGASRLAERGRLASVDITDTGLRVALALALLDDADEQAAASGSGHGVAALSDEELEEWQRVEDELDGFVTVVVQNLASRTDDRELQLALMSLLIDVRMRIAELLSSDRDSDPDSDPLRELFLDSWSTLSRVAAQLPVSDTGADGGLQMAAFLAAGDALQLADALGPAYGIEISRDGLLRLARMLLADGAPASFTPLPTEENPQLKSLFQIGMQRSGEPPRMRFDGPPSFVRALLPISPAYADATDPALVLREVFPQHSNLDFYLGVVAELIELTLEEHWRDSRLPEEHRARFEPLVRATAWKETCWRHYLPIRDERDGDMRVIRSGVGAVGMMQIVGRVWRSLFDLERLEEDVAYNLEAGIDILEHYYIDYAMRRGEDQHPGGGDNLVRATYAAYNGGPSKLRRYRADNISPRARAVDEQFYRQYQVMVENTWPQESRCYRR